MKKHILKLAAAIATTAILLTACTPEQVEPTTDALLANTATVSEQTHYPIPTTLAGTQWQVDIDTFMYDTWRNYQFDAHIIGTHTLEFEDNGVGRAIWHVSPETVVNETTGITTEETEVFHYTYNPESGSGEITTNPYGYENTSPIIFDKQSGTLHYGSHFYAQVL